MVTPESNPYRCYYDFEICISTDDLKRCLAKINYNGFALVCVTHSAGRYTVFFRRPPV